MNMRIEKNRHHLATLIAATLGVTMILIVNQIWPLRQLSLTIWTAIAILIGRTVVIETGIRRSASRVGTYLNRVGVEMAEKHLGIVILPHDPEADSNTEKTK